MLISLQSANRWNNKEFLRMFRDSGRYPTLFPDSDDILAEGRLLQSHPDLERAYAGGPIKHSLFNVCKIHSPVVVLDEAHKAYGKRSGAVEEFVQSINRFDPSMVIELTATPDPKISNLLVDISGVELKNEEMIKLPIRVDTTTEAEWYYTLNWAAEKLEQLAGEANILQHREGRYIRPIAVVRVERTGKAQIENEQFLHAQRVRNYLIQRLGVPENEIAIKSADNNELKGVNLLAESCPVRWIITKDALREGWDCAFAYVLVMLDKTSAETAITQLVGRVMRQPGAQRTGVSALDQSYVFCWDLNVEKAVLQVRKGLEQEGLNDLGDDVLGGESLGIKPLLVQRRVGFRGKTIYLPRVLHQEYGNWIDLDYHKHILPEIDWDSIGAPENIPRSLPDTVRRQTAAVDVDTDPIYDVQQTANVVPTLEISWFARRLSDLIPNPWQAARIVQELLQQLRDSEESEEEIYARRSFLAFFLQQHVADKVTELSEIVFRKKLRDGDIRFDLELGEPNYRMVESYELPIPANDSHFQRNHAQPLQLSLFDPIYNSQFDSTPERQFAKYLDEQKALHWWHRVAARQRNEYYYQGWKRERIYPDFIAMASEENGKPCLLIFETKGLHLSGNPDTTYKQRVMEVLEGAFNAGKVTVHNGPVKGVFKILFREVEFSTALAPCME